MIARKYEMRVNENRLPYLAAVGRTRIADTEKHDNPQKMANIIRETYHAERLPEEHVYLMAFDVKLHLIGIFELSHGTGRESVLSPGQIMQRLFLCGAGVFSIAHNHPSGDVIPSKEDDRLTERIAKVAKICGIDFCDHLIIAGAHKNKYYSYRENASELLN